MNRLQSEKGMTVLELVIAMSIGATLVTVLATAVSILLWLPGERRDRVTVAQDLSFAEHWLTRDANAANSFTSGTGTVYGAFRWFDYTGASRADYVVTYTYDAANGYLMRTEQRNGVISSTLAIAKNIISQGDAVFVWNPSTYSAQISLTSTVTATASLSEGITSTVRSAKATVASRPRSEPLVSPPGDVSIPPPPPGSESYYVDTDPVVIIGTYVSGGAAQLQSADSACYEVDSSVGNPKEVVYTLRSQSLTAPTTISQIQVRFVGSADKRDITVDFHVKNSDAGFPSTTESGFTFTTPGEVRTSSFVLSPGALTYVNSLADRRVDLKVSAHSTVLFSLCTDQIAFIASP